MEENDQNKKSNGQQGSAQDLEKGSAQQPPQEGAAAENTPVQQAPELQEPVLDNMAENIEWIPVLAANLFYKEDLEREIQRVPNQNARLEFNNQAVRRAAQIVTEPSYEADSPKEPNKKKY